MGPTGTNPLSQYPKHREKIVGGSKEGGFYLSFCYGLQIESDIQYPDYLLSMKTKFFSFFMKAEVCTNVLRAESVSNTYYHKLALKYWKLAAMQLSDLPSPLYKPSKEAHRCGHFTLPTGLCHFVLEQVLVWRLERRLCLFVCTLIRA